MRRYSELPRMDYDTKASIMGAAASALPKSERVVQNIEKRGHPFSWFEVKPVTLEQRFFEHLGVTHIVDFTPSVSRAIAAAGAIEYEGLCCKQEHADWCDATVDKILEYIAGKDPAFTRQLGAEEEFADRCLHFFSNTMLDARRWVDPTAEDLKSDAEEENDNDDSDGED